MTGERAPPADGTDGTADTAEVEELLERLEDLTDTGAEREQVRAAVQSEMGIDIGLFGRVVAGFDRGDVMEAVLGSVVFGIPMFVEGGTTEVGAHFATHPVGTAATVGFTIAVVYGILYVSDIQDVRITRRLFGILPRRLVGVLAVAALGSVAVAFVPMAVGAALSDILPGT